MRGLASFAVVCFVFVCVASLAPPVFSAIVRYRRRPRRRVYRDPRVAQLEDLDLFIRVLHEHDRPDAAARLERMREKHYRSFREFDVNQALKSIQRVS